MTNRLHSDWLRSYLQHSQHSEAPDSFHFWTGVSVIAGALRRKVWIDMGYFQWTPNFYIVFVAPPGIVSKSTTANIGMRLLREVPGIGFGPDAVTWQSLIQSLANSTETFEMPDGTQNAMSSITIVSSEFGTFLNPNDREMVDMLVSLWDGQIGVFEKSTKTQGNDSIINPWINILACTTPAWIAGNFPEYMIGGGFTSRTVFVYGEQKRNLVAYPADHIPPNFQQEQEALIHDLEIIATQMQGEYHLSPEARAYGEEWYEEHYKSKPAHLDDERFGGYIARKQTHIHKLAMVLAASQSNELIIHKHHLSDSNAIITGLEADMPKVFSNINSQSAKTTNRLIDIVRRNGKMPTQHVLRSMLQSHSYNEFQEALNGAIASGVIKQKQEGNELYLYCARESASAQQVNA